MEHKTSKFKCLLKIRKITYLGSQNILCHTDTHTLIASKFDMLVQFEMKVNFAG